LEDENGKLKENERMVETLKKLGNI